MGAILLIVVPATPALAQNRRAKGTQVIAPKPAPVAAPTPAPRELAADAAASRAKLMAASHTYRESLERLLKLQKQDETKALELVARRRQLLALGVLARREVEESEALLQAAQKKVSETNQRLDEVEQLLAEVLAAEQIANQPPEPEIVEPSRSGVLLVRYVGRSNWLLTNDYLKVDAFFRGQFGHALPLSAFGQTETHTRLGFDHANALDVAVHPDSLEGQALQGFLRAAGISFIAIRGAIAGSATGAHLHIGPPSKRLGQ